MSSLQATLLPRSDRGRWLLAAGTAALALAVPIVMARSRKNSKSAEKDGRKRKYVDDLEVVGSKVGDTGDAKEYDIVIIGGGMSFVRSDPVPQSETQCNRHSGLRTGRPTF